MRTNLKEGVLVVIGYHCAMLGFVANGFQCGMTLGMDHCKNRSVLVRKSSPFSVGLSWNSGQGGACKRYGGLSPKLVTHNPQR